MHVIFRDWMWTAVQYFSFPKLESMPGGFPHSRCSRFSTRVFKPNRRNSQIYLPRLLRDTHTENRCADVIKEMRSGKWRLRRDLLPEDVQRRVDEDIRMRKLRGLPIMLYRDDMRCGNMLPFKFPTRSGTKLSALCDPHSRAPCCNHKSGWCGSGQENCSCNNCTDYRNTVAAGVKRICFFIRMPVQKLHKQASVSTIV